MDSISKSIIFKSNYFSILLCLMPVSFIAGNMIININIILLILSSIFIFKNNLFKIRYYLVDKTIFLFFFLVLFTGIYNDVELYINQKDFSVYRGYFTTTIKSVLFLKYLFLYISLRYLLENQYLKFNFFFISCFVSSLFVSFDIFYQFLFGQDIFGFEPLGDGRKLSGPFNDELIAGGYLQRFSIFAFFTLPFFYKKKFDNFSKFIYPALFLIFILAIILSGNRMHLILFLFAVFLIMLFEKKNRKSFFYFFLSFTIIFVIIFNLNSSVKTNFRGFYKQVSGMVIVLFNKDSKQKQSIAYLNEFSTFYETWLFNKYIGGGIKNFRYFCHTRSVKKEIVPKSKMVCNMHPHNYYLEILTETGIIGFITAISFILITLYISLYQKYFTDNPLKKNVLIVPFLFLFIAEIFPIKSTGSFFTTGNTTYIFLIMALLVGLSKNTIYLKK